MTRKRLQELKKRAANEGSGACAMTGTELGELVDLAYKYYETMAVVEKTIVQLNDSAAPFDSACMQLRNLVKPK